MGNASGFVIEDGVLKKYIGLGGDVVIPKGITRIEYYAFNKCLTITSVSIPEGVMSIGDSAFEGCFNLTTVALPESMKSIGERAFYGCMNLKSIRIPDGVGKIGEYDFDKKTHFLIKDISKIPSSLRTNAVVGFAENGGGKSTPGFDSHSKYIKTNAAKLVDTAMSEPALLSLMCLEKLITPKNVEIYITAAQKTRNAELITIMLDYQENKINSKEKECLEKRKEKEQNIITDRMMARQEKAGIEGLNIAVTGILVTFADRDSLKTFILTKGGKLSSSLTTKVDYLIMNDPEFNSSKAKEARELGIEIISEYRFNELAGRAFIMNETELTGYLGSGGDVLIPDVVTKIGYSAFGGCNNITSVTIPGSVISIDDDAFRSCNRLTSIFIPQSVTSIGNYVFAKCPNLTIHTPLGSYAEKYAKKKKIPFVTN